MLQRLIFACLFALSLAVAAFGQRFGGGGPGGPFHVMPNVNYDGRFTFVRVTYQTAPGGYWYGGWPAWAHGYPLAEQNLMRIMSELTMLGPNTENIDTMTLDHPALGRYPIAYLLE